MKSDICSEKMVFVMVSYQLILFSSGHQSAILISNKVFPFSSFEYLKWGCASQSTNAESGWPAHPPLLWPRGLLYFTINEVWRYFWFFGPYRPVQGPKCLILRNLWFWRGLTFCLIALAFVDQSFWKFQGFKSIYWAIERAFKDF